MQLAPAGIGNDPAGKILQTLQLDLVRHCHRLPLPGQQHEQPASVQPAQAEDPHRDRIEPVEVEQEPAVHPGVGQRLLKLGQIDHS